jgi:hypothetical protein
VGVAVMFEHVIARYDPQRVASRPLVEPEITWDVALMWRPGYLSRARGPGWTACGRSIPARCRGRTSRRFRSPSLPRVPGPGGHRWCGPNAPASAAPRTCQSRCRPCAGATRHRGIAGVIGQPRRCRALHHNDTETYATPTFSCRCCGLLCHSHAARPGGWRPCASSCPAPPAAPLT